MKLKLTYLLLAVLVLAVTATVWIQIERARQARQREAMQKIIDATAARLNLPPEVLYADAETRAKFLHIRKSLSQKLRTKDPSRYPNMDGTDYTDGDGEPEPEAAGSQGGGIFGTPHPTTLPASLPSDEVLALNEDEPLARINDAMDACREMAAWYETPENPVGAYLRKHPEIFTNQIQPALLRLTRAEDKDLKACALTVLCVQGDRSKLKELFATCGDGKITSEALSFISSSVDFPRGYKPLDDPYAKLPAYNLRPDGAEEFKEAILPLGATRLLGETRFRHDGAIAAVAFSPDSKTLATAGGRTVCLWDSQSGKLAGHVTVKGPKPIAGVAFASDSIVAILAGDVWVWAPGEKSPGTKKEGDFSQIVVSPDHKLLAASERKTPAVQLLELPSLKLARRIVGPPPPPPQTPEDESGMAYPVDESTAITGFDDVKFSCDGKTLIGELTSDSNPLRTYDVSTGGAIHEIPVSPDGFAGTFAPTAYGKIVLTNHSGQTEFWDIATGRKEQSLDKYMEFIGGTPSGKTLFARVTERDKNGSGPAVPYLLDAKTLQPIRKVGSEVYRIDVVSPDGALAAGIAGNCVNLWDLNRDAWRVGPRRALTLLDAGAGMVYAATDNPNAGENENSADETMRVWDIAQDRELPSPLPKDENFRYAAVSISGKKMATCSQVQKAKEESDESPGPFEIRLWDLQGNSTGQIAPPGGQPGRLVFSPEGDLLAWLSCGPVCVWDTESKEQLLRCPSRYWDRAPLPDQGKWDDRDAGVTYGAPASASHAIPLKTAIAFNGANFYRGAIDKDSGEALLGLGTLGKYTMARELETLNPLIAVNNVALSGDCRLATEGAGNVTIWRVNPDFTRHVPVRQFAAPEGMNATGGEPMMWLDDDFLLTACKGDCLLIWDVRTCKPIARLRIPSTVVSFLTEPNDSAFYTSHADSTVILWDKATISLWCKDIKDRAAK